MAQPIASQPVNLLKNKSFVVTPAHDLLLRDLHTLHRATAEQLTRLNYKPGMLNTVKARLKDLSDNHYILPLSHPSIRLPYMYALDRKGLNYLYSLGLDVQEYFRPGREEETARNFHFRQHMLAISDIIIHAMLFERSYPSYRINTMLHERYFKNHPIKVTYTKSGTVLTITLVPDIYVAFACTNSQGNEYLMPVVVELDRGTEDQKYFRKKIRAYIEFLKSRTFRKVFGIDNITIAFPTTADHSRVKKMQEWTQKELAMTNEPSWLWQLFVFTSLSENMGELEPQQLFLDPVWYTPSVVLQPVSLLGE